MKKKNVKKNEKNKIAKEDLNKVKQILSQIEEDPKSYEFKEPVDVEGLGLDDYLSIIDKPMDISTVKKNITTGKYASVKEVYDEIQLIWDNCRTYNENDSEIWKMANSLDKMTKKMFEKTFSNLFKNNEKSEKKVRKYTKRGRTSSATSPETQDKIIEQKEIKDDDNSNENNVKTDKTYESDEEKKEESMIKKEKVKENRKKEKSDSSSEKSNTKKKKNEKEIIKKDSPILKGKTKKDIKLKYPSLEEKKKINDTIRNLSIPNLGAVINFLTEQCSECIDDKDENKIKIIVNKIDTITCEKLFKMFDDIKKN